MLVIFLRQFNTKCGVKLALSVQTSSLSEMMQQWKCFLRAGKMSTLAYNWVNNRT